MNRSARIGIALAALVCTHAATLYFRTGAIERDLRQQTRAALDNRDLQHIVIALRGRDMTLQGQVTDAESAALAESLASGIVGLRVVHNQLRIGR